MLVVVGPLAVLSLVADVKVLSGSFLPGMHCPVGVGRMRDVTGRPASPRERCAPCLCCHDMMLQMSALAYQDMTYAGTAAMEVTGRKYYSRVRCSVCWVRWYGVGGYVLQCMLGAVVWGWRICAAVCAVVDCHSITCQ
jgi:hypothetical protein